MKKTIVMLIVMLITLHSVTASLSNPSVTGVAGVPGYYNDEEAVMISIDANVDGPVTDASQVFVNSVNFETCSDGTCTASIVNRITDQFDIRAVTTEGLTDSSLQVFGTIDTTAPAIEFFEVITPQVKENGDLIVTYRVRDSSNVRRNDRCAGIKVVTISAGGAPLEVGAGSLPSASGGSQVYFVNNCVLEDTATIPASELGGSGVVDILFTVTDNMGLSTTATSSFVYDITSPAANGLNAEFNGRPLRFVGANGLGDVILSFQINDDSLDIDSVRVDASALSPSNPSPQSSMSAQCIEKHGGAYDCSVHNVKIEVGGPVTITARDSAGNEGSSLLDLSVSTDVTGPTVNKFESEYGNFLGAESAITIEFGDDSGILPSDIFLDLSSIRAGADSVKPTRCDDGTCVWEEITANAADGSKTITVTGFDVLGNPIDERAEEFILDTQRPEVLSIDVSARGVGEEAIEGVIRTGEKIDLTVRVHDSTSIVAKADFSNFVSGEDATTGTCVADGSDYVCTWTSREIDLSNPAILPVEVSIVDEAGNKVEGSIDISVLADETDSEVSFWRTVSECSPKTVDRQITPLKQVRVYCRAGLLPTQFENDARILDVGFDGLGSCTETIEGSKNFVDSVELVGFEGEAYIAIDLSEAEMSIDEIGLNCPLIVTTESGRSVYREDTPVAMKVGFYNMPLGRYGDAVQEEIDRSKDYALNGLSKTIGGLKKLFDSARKACTALRTIHKIKLAAEAVTSGMTIAHIGSAGTPTEPLLGRLRVGMCKGDKHVGTVAEKSYAAGNQFCKFVNCQLGGETNNNEKGSRFDKIFQSLSKGQWFSKAFDEQQVSFLGELAGAKGGRGTFEEVFGKKYYQYANAKDNLLVATVTGCIPGIINGLEKFRQTECMYVDCLQQNAVNNVPPAICQDQRYYAHCKHIFGEIFSVVPWTAFFDFYVGTVKSALSDPLSSAGVIAGAYCKPQCAQDPDVAGAQKWQAQNTLCWGAHFLAVTGDLINDIDTIKDDWKKEPEVSYCDRLEDES